MRYGSLFSGIGGMDLGLDRAGMECAWQVEIDDYARKVLTKHWPAVPKYRDVRECGAHNLSDVDLIAGGFPCQDLSYAGKGAGIDGARSGLWSEFHRIICELRPRFVLVENVPALLGRGMGRVLGDLAASGYDAEWDCIPAAAVGAPHIRDRLFVLAHAEGITEREPADKAEPVASCGHSRHEPLCRCEYAPNTAIQQLQGQRAEGQQVAAALGSGRIFGRGCSHVREWAVEPAVGGIIDGFSRWLDGFNGMTESHRLCYTYGYESSEASPLKALRTLRNKVREEAVQWHAGRFGGVSPSQVLLTYLCKLEESWSDETRLQLESAQASKNRMRGVWSDDKFARAPRGSEHGEQCAGEYSDSLQAMSRLLAQHAAQAWENYSRTNAAPVLNPWAGDWENDLPRVLKAVPARVDRLRGLGNAVVPQVAELLGRWIMNADIGRGAALLNADGVL